ncbi:Similar to S.cerevisiae protein SPO11 (Meiosis-specific protein that initiates meiotic recombination) [Malassezia sympodialis ATCC 42132]|uniref:DNA topoisomerase (ATP-hydrolyzing) n=1 Tax=Malassezia sympodialis (strain ATCC 42132) TaxID=1230383 RepID=A0A1M8A6W1_MALS4|nr:Similar to S.cerevisiae protein SPO11 (Meiosis-specific protein that initiates meiotic recombination) [Malassezia sympodialis ATCC 42132]
MMDRSKGYMYVNKRSRDDSISKIENFLRFFMQGIQDIPLTGKPLSVSMGAPRSKDQLARVQWEFPSKRDKNMKQWAQFFSVMAQVHAALVSDTVLSKRDIFYRDPILFGTQAKADSMLARLALTLQCSRSSLNICASPRSIALGPLDFIGRNSISRCLHKEQLIPDALDPAHIRTSASWALVVEKHAIFQTLQSCNFLHHAATYGITGAGLLITGKGYPDYAVRSFLWLLGTSFNLKIFILMDADPHGLDIARIYMDALIPYKHVYWLGLRTNLWMEIGRPGTWQLLNLADRQKALHLLRSRKMHPILRNELAAQLHAGYKCELEVLCQDKSGTPAQAASGQLLQLIYSQMKSQMIKPS